MTASDPRPEPIPVSEPPPTEPPEPVEKEEDDRAADVIRKQCRALYPGSPCIITYAADMKAVIATYDCVDWCPVLGKRLNYA
jgi:hypothetical protein